MQVRRTETTPKKKVARKLLTMQNVSAVQKDTLEKHVEFNGESTDTGATSDSEFSNAMCKLLKPFFLTLHTNKIGVSLCNFEYLNNLVLLSTQDILTALTFFVCLICYISTICHFSLKIYIVFRFKAAHSSEDMVNARKSCC